MHLTVASGTGNATDYFTFDANSGNQPRTGTLTIAGQTVTVTQAALVVAATPPLLTEETWLANGSLQFSFTNTPGASFTVLTSTNLTLPLSQWPVAGAATDLGGGVFQFTTPGPANGAQAFYLVRSP